jgi:hypothetical protein
MTGFAGLFDTARHCTLQFPVKHTHTTSTVTSYLPLPGSDVQRRTFPSCAFPNNPVPQLPFVSLFGSTVVQVLNVQALPSNGTTGHSTSRFCFLVLGFNV